MLSVVMYHYVRNLDSSPFPDIKGLDIRRFKSQLDFFEKYFTVVSPGQVLSWYLHGTPIPENAVWLTFDDGYVDHFDNVLPELNRRGLSGTFFVPSGVLEGRMLDVNLIHILLAGVPIDDLVLRLEEVSLECGISPVMMNALQAKFMHPNRYDEPSVNYVKRSLQRGLPRSIRPQIIRALAGEFLPYAEPELASMTYMSEGQVMSLLQAGMSIGGHGADHLWLDSISEAELHSEISGSVEIMKKFSLSDESWVMSYPYGAYSPAVIDKLRQSGFKLAVTTEPRTATGRKLERHSIPRFDTNDFPQ
jgi:peptidoglycan/xylan/chitin deacetylase (PgdA/CDA1 family)